jgi:hypothetical protein
VRVEATQPTDSKTHVTACGGETFCSALRRISICQGLQEGDNVVDLAFPERRWIARLLPERRLVIDVLPLLGRQVVIFPNGAACAARKPLLRPCVALGIKGYGIA